MLMAAPTQAVRIKAEVPTALPGRDLEHRRSGASPLDKGAHLQEFKDFKAKILEHTTRTGGAFAGRIPEHYLEHIAHDFQSS